VSGLEEEFARLPGLLGAHMMLTAAAMSLGATLSLPLGIACARSAALRGPALAFASVVQTVPALALLALMVPLLGRIGFMPAFAALTLYSMLPMLRNAIVGLDGVDPAVKEASRAVGMTPWQALARVELPLAAPAIIAGVRTATVWVVGAATLSTPVGAPSLGDYIFSGLQTRNWDAVLFGCLFSAGLAIALDQLLRLAESGVAARRPGRAWAALAAFAALVAAALLPALAPSAARLGDPAAPRATAASGGEDGLEGRRVIIGAKSFTEQYILSELLRIQLARAGARAETRGNLGSTVAFDALAADEIDLYVDYTGTLWANVLKQDSPIQRDRMMTRAGAALLERYGVLQLGGLGFENAYGFAVTADTAARLPAPTIGGLAALGAPQIGADPEFFARPEWRRARDLYGLEGARERSMDSTFMYGAARDGAVDAITAYTTDGRIAAFDLVVLDDPREALPPYDAVLLISPAAKDNPALLDALRPLLNAIPPALMRQANRRVDIDGQSPREAARWLDARLAAARRAKTARPADARD